MRGAYILLALALIGFGVWYHQLHGDPTPEQIEPLVRDFLAQEPCEAGTRTVKQLGSVTIGSYVKEFGGWPVYANHVDECGDGNQVVTNDSSHDAERQIAVAFARRGTSGRFELYTPELFAQGQKQMSEALQKAFDSVQVKP